MDRNATSLQRQRIPNEKRKECLKLFEQGYGYKKTAPACRTQYIYSQGIQAAVCSGRQYLGRKGKP